MPTIPQSLVLTSQNPFLDRALQLNFRVDNSSKIQSVTSGLPVSRFDATIVS